MTSYEVHEIGTISNNGDEVFIKIAQQYIPALKALDGFSHLQVIWWFSDFDYESARAVLDVDKPYTKAPGQMGIFATRSPLRPNPIALTVVEVIHIDYESGIIQVGYIDANDGTPLLDIKPYTPSYDRVETPKVPNWCSHWPMSLEKSADFEWEKEFTF